MDGLVNFSHCNDFKRAFSNVAKVLDIWVKPVDDHNPLGQLEDGSITLCGPAVLWQELQGRLLGMIDLCLTAWWNESDVYELDATVVALIIVVPTGVVISMLLRACALLVTPSLDQAEK